MEPSPHLKTAIADAHRRLIAERLPLFTGGWLTATVFWVVVAMGDAGATVLARVLHCAAHGGLFGLAVLLRRHTPPSGVLQAASIAICAATALAGTAFAVHVEASAAIIAMMLFAVGVTSSLLFAWRGPGALVMFAATWGPWLLLAQPWPALGLTPFQCAAGAVVGGVVFTIIAEAAFAGLRTTVEAEERQAAQAAALRASHDSYRALAEDTTDLIWTADLDWRFTYANAAAARAIGRAAPAIVGLPLRAVLTTHPANADLETVWSAVAAGHPQPPRVIQVRPGALHPEPRWFEVSASPALDAAGQVIGVRGMSRDVTARVHAEERLRESEARFRSAFGNASVGMLMVDLSGHPIQANPALLAMLGYSEDELRSVTILDITHPDDHEATRTSLAQLIAGERQSFDLEKRYLCKDGHVLWGHVNASLIRDDHGAPLYTLGLVQDVTARHTSLEALRTSEQKLRRLAHAQAEVREEERKRLGFDLHDDVCQELVGVGILIESVCYQQGSDAPGAEALRRAVRYVNEVVEHLRQLARDLRPLPLRDLGLEGALRAFAAGVDSAATRVEVDVPVPVPRLAEETEVTFYRIAHEAITNAVRHARARTVTVRLQTRDRQLSLEVQDDGRGFDPAARRASSIGLAGMEERALARGGALTIRSAPGEGTRVTLTCTLTASELASAA